ncbi:Dynein heavy chain family protein [Trichomonas vaginalis G3]|uniref:Dynein heavy chain family protein n=1 Tax=Trichomonas vaginalis (strain ATCC PRA-98 / G3) TaxID=412133 RepID=A2DFX5_TRIV3|nr:dynein light chain binding [Trichomonas vaginalis G3]EAY20602.1 Dynein heavy chain family protein [Trichomonas vaginalis G3]KAI5487210.1 dynein light chain binding [Trichomonas vaginalis G3]|eukprot:XP_001581588.1 Dynein heavy chain family protein [Trichomonas vaginalis G3]
MYRTVLSSLSDPNGAGKGNNAQNDPHKRKYVNPFSEALHQEVPDYKSLGIFITEPLQVPKAILFTPYKGKPIDVIAELKRRGIDLSKPSNLWDTNIQFQSFLDIKYFEDTMLSPLQPEMMLGMLKEVPPQAFRFYKGVCMLEYVTDIAYQQSTGLYNVRFRDGKSSLLSPLFVLFPFEDPVAFVDRLERAFALRRLEESWFRYWLYVKNIPSDDLQSLTQSDRNRLLTTITKSPKFKLFAKNGSKYEFSKKILDEVDTQMKMVTNSIIFNMRILSNPLLYRGLNLPLPRLPGSIEEIPTPSTEGDLIIKEKIKTIQGIHLFTNDWFVNAAPIIVSWCLDISNSCLFNTICPQALPLDQWQRHHRNYEKNMISKARMKFISQVSTIIFDVIRNIKPPYSLTEFNKAIYLESPLGRFIGLCNQIIQSHLVDFILNSIYWFDQYVKEKSPTQVNVVDFRKVENIFPTNEEHTPIFTVFLECVEGEVKFQPQLDYFVSAVNEEIEYAISSFEDFQKIETSVLKAMMWTPVPVYILPDLESKEVVGLKNSIKSMIDESIKHMNEYVSSLSIFDELLKGSATDFANKLKDSEADLDKVKDAIAKVESQQKELHLNFPFKITIGLFRIDLTNIRKTLHQKLSERRLALLQLLLSVSHQQMKDIQKSYENIWSKLLEEPKTIEALVSQRDFIDNLNKKLADLKKQFGEVLKYLDTVEDMYVSIPDEQDSLRWELVGYEKKILTKSTEVSNALKVNKVKLQKALQCDTMMLTSQITSITSAIAGVFAFNDINQHMSYVARVRGIQTKLDEALEKAELYNMREKLCDMEISNYSQLKSQQDAFAPYKMFWEAISNWKTSVDKWRKVPLSQLNAADVESQFAGIQQQLVQSSRVITDKEILAIGQATRAEMDGFKKFLPIFSIMLNPGMTDKHWKQLCDLVGANITLTPTMTLQNTIELKLADHIANAQEISTAATNEHNIKTSLKKIADQWGETVLDITNYKETDWLILHTCEDIINQLDENLITLQAINFSQYKAPFEEEITSWTTGLQLTLHVIEKWLECQAKYLYLAPIFSSKDICHQLPNEGIRFQKIAEDWDTSLKKAKEIQNAYKFCNDNDLFQFFKKALVELESIERALIEYLETKRTAFPRFYFLSNEELLKILSQTTSPSAVQPYLKRCFENIGSITFKGTDCVTEMISIEGERVPFSKPTNLTGSVEHWMLDVEGEMRNTLEKIMEQAVTEYPTRPRTEWIDIWPAQITIAVFQIMWTTAVENAIKGKSLKQLYETIFGQLLELAKLTTTNLTDIARVAVSSLIVMEMHNRDVVRKLADQNISDINQFEWISQLRQYFVNGYDVIRMVNAEFRYGYEYLGSTPRLVITPLTDRCYLTLLTALDMQMGGAPQGPAGTGKTETTKDLAKVVAKQCVVFNCSEGLDYLQMGTFFTGLSSCGAWACFDEFNRIDIEVLSVIAQQIATIQAAIQQHKHHFTFEGREVRLNPTCAIFITMNPGYAGRTELPDNLKALFRPVAMMVPDYTMIAEILLYSFGFETAKSLAVKITSTFRLSSEQLSNQSHYDFGMRAVKTVINTAGNLLQREKDLSEQLIILRALKDVNVPKFTRQDLPLFNNIISDLFPNVQEKHLDYTNLIAAIREVCKKKKLKDSMIDKAIELYETVGVRHGVMLVGPAGCGKTVCYETLAEALTILSKDNQQYSPVQPTIINPKSITLGQLYGDFDPHSHDFTDGLLADAVRFASAEPPPVHHWIVLDGPVDALWIENMNTVLDDNKKLCLSSSEVIPLTPRMRMFFEVEDLKVASPATVSRCGMVYIENKIHDYESLLYTWLLNHEDKRAVLEPQITKFIPDVLVPAIDFVKAEIKSVLPFHEYTFFSNFLNLLSAILKSEKDLTNINNFMIFSLYWSLGAMTNGQDRQAFDTTVKGILDKQNIPRPDELTLFDYCVKGNEWTKWIDMTDKPPEGGVPSDAIIPTVETTRHSWVINALVMNGIAVLVTGVTGSGKTVTLQKYIESQPTLVNNPLTFSAQTTANGVQDLIDSKFDRRSAGIFGPPIDHRAIIFVDDINMPRKEKYGAQPPIELLRQLLSQGGWYDRKKRTFKKFVDVQMVCSMRSPEGPEQTPTGRFLRHFHQIVFPEISNDSMTRIFHAILSHPLQAVSDVIEPLIKASVEIYDTVCKQLLPTPSRVHYTFNLRDIAQVIRGVTSLHSSQANDKNNVLRIWYHESIRVYHDRLVNDENRDWFMRLLKRVLHETFGVRHFHLSSIEPVIYADFGVDDSKKYQQVTDLEKFTRVCQNNLDDYNAANSHPLDLCLFSEAIQHLCRICRIIREPGRNGLLLGVGGSGRQSLTRLAAYICGVQLFQPEVSRSYSRVEWRQDLKRLLLDCGLQKKETVFLVSESQLIDESFFEDINCLLNSGDPPALFDDDDMEKIITGTTPLAKTLGIVATRASVYSLFISQVKSHMHVMIALSPIGSSFRRRVRMFPSLISCCTIDWFAEWPIEALENVSTRVIGPEYSKFCASAHSIVSNYCQKFFEEMKRTNYVTPSTFLSFLNLITSLGDRLKTKLETTTNNIQKGLQKMEEASKEIVVLEKNIRELQPELARRKDETVIMIRELSANQEQAKATKDKVAAATKEAEEQSVIADQLSQQAAEDLKQVEPKIEAAVQALSKLSRSEISELKAVAVETEPMRLVCTALCIIFDEPPKKGKRPNGQPYDDYFSAAKSILADPNFVKRLKDWIGLNKDKISPVKMQKLRVVLDNPDFAPEVMSSKSQAMGTICLWVHAIELYYNVNVEVEPKRRKKAEAEKNQQEALKIVEENKAKLADIEAKVAELEEKHKKSEQELKELTDKKEKCTIRLQNASILTSSLEHERESWQKMLVDFDAQKRRITGDLLLAAASVAYLGPFTSDFRKLILLEWSQKLEEFGFPRTPGGNITKILGDPLTVLQWNLKALPRDDLSIENAIVLTECRKWPLIIDPQNQASNFIKNIEPEILVLRPKEKTFVRSLENAINFGRPVLVEGIDEELDPSLDPILMISSRDKPVQIKLEHQVTLNPTFKLYMVTTNPNPTFSPENLAKVTLINFTITQTALSDQLLALVVAKEKPNLEKEKETLVVNNAQMKSQMLEIQAKILQLLQESKGDILDDVELINTLAESNKTQKTLTVSMAQSEETEKQIDSSRREYEPVARRGALLYFCVIDLRHVAPMYQYSLSWYAGLVSKLISAAPHSAVLEERIANLIQYITLKVFKNISNSLFAKHQLMFAFLIAARIKLDKGDITENEWKFLLTGTTETTQEPPPNKVPESITDATWAELFNLSQIEVFDGFDNYVAEHVQDVLKIENFFEDPIGGSYDERMNLFRRLCIARCLRPDTLVDGFTKMIREDLGDEYLVVEPSNISQAYADAGPTTPIIFILSSGTDPAQDVQNFAAQMGFLEKLRALSLGQGQGTKAAELIENGRTEGFWVLLQNCHLATSWMPKLEEILQNLKDVHNDFRLWLTSMPSAAFPVSILQNGIKVTTEPPQGLKATLTQLFQSYGQKTLKECPRENEFKSLFYSLCFFHAVVLGRRKYGPLGWNCIYEWTKGDLDISRKQLNLFLSATGPIPYKTLGFLAGEINYGGRVTDDWDRRTLLTLCQDFYREEVLKEGFNIAGNYMTPPPSNLPEYLEVINQYSVTDTPELFGLHQNADLNLKQQTSFTILSDILSTRPRGGGNSSGGNNSLVQTVNALLRKVPQQLDMKTIQEKFPNVYEESMNTVLQQEAVRYNELLQLIETSLKALIKAMKGLIVFTNELEEMSTAIDQNVVPPNWAAIAYPSMKPLNSWMADLNDRLKFLRDWIDFGQPRVFWISGFFFPQAFLTGTKQNFARKYKVPIDEISFDFQVQDKGPQRIIRPPQDGVYIYGLYLEACGYDTIGKKLVDALPRQLTQEMPVIWLKPVQNRVTPTTGIYRCPVYKIGTRQGVLTTTGHSSNYVLTIELPTDVDEAFWIKRGVALLCSLSR